MTVSVYTNGYKISPTNLSVRWKSSVPARRHSYSRGCSLIIPLNTSASWGLNLRKELNFNSLNLFWGPQNCLLQLRMKLYASLKWVRIFCDCVLWFQLVLQLSLCPSFILNFSRCHAQLRQIRTLKQNSIPYEPLLWTYLPFFFCSPPVHLISSQTLL